MPNWVYNTLTIQGPKSEIDFIKDKLNQPFKVLHDSWNMKTNEMEVSESIYSAPVFAFWNIHSPLEDGITMEEYVQQPNRLGISTDSPDWFAKEVEHAKTQKDWYNWNTSKWGTKWDVSTEGLEYTDNGDGTSTIEGYFDSAWSPPVEAFTTLAQDWDSCYIELKYFEPGMCFIGLYDSEGGDDYWENVDELLETTAEEDPVLHGLIEDFCAADWYASEEELETVWGGNHEA